MSTSVAHLNPMPTFADVATPEPGTVPVLHPVEYQPVFVWSNVERDYLPGVILEVAPEPLESVTWAFVSYDTKWGRKETWLPTPFLSVRMAETTAVAIAS